MERRHTHGASGESSKLGDEKEAERATSMTDVSEDAEIIELDDFRAGTEPIVRAVRGPVCFCKIVVSPHARTVLCSKCKRVWDPIDALVFLAKNLDRWVQNRDNVMREYKRYAEKLKNMKARVKRAKGKPDE